MARSVTETLAPAFRHRAWSLRNASGEVTQSLLKLQLAGLMNTELLAALCDVTKGVPQLDGFRKVFLGLRELMACEHESLDEGWL